MIVHQLQRFIHPRMCDDMKRWYRIIAFLLTLAMLIPTIAHMPMIVKAQEDSDSGKPFKLGMFGEPDYLNPVLAGSIAGWEFINWIYDPLIRWDDDWGVQPGLAESWEWADNGTQLTLHLVQNATWHDGTPFTSADVNWTLFTWTWLGWWVAQTSRIDHRNIRCPDDYTIVLNFVESGYESIWAWAPAPTYAYYRDSYDGTPVEVNKEYFLTGLTYVPILPMHLWDQITWNDPVYGLNGSYYTTFDPPYDNFWGFGNWDAISWNIIVPTFDTPEIGTGMFELSEYVTGEYAFFEANADYHWGAPNIDNITVIFYSSVETMTSALAAGEIDFCETEAPFVTSALANEGVELNAQSFLGWEALLIDQDWVYCNATDKFALREPAVKKAINQAVNKTKVASIAYQGYANPAHSVVHSELKWFNDELELFDSGVAAAKTTLDADGWTLNEDDVYEKELNGSTKALEFTLKYVSGAAVDLSMVQLIESDLEEAGFDITLQALDVTTFLLDTAADSRNFDLAVTFWSQIGDPNSIAQYMTTGSWINPTGLSIPRVDEIYSEQQLADDAEREDLIDELQQLVYDEASICVLVEFDDLELYRSDKWEFTHEDWLSGIFSIWNWETWLEADIVVITPAVFPIEMIAIIAGVVIVVVIVLLLVWRSKKG
jgi:ABC-type transport system substrate-binding protein